MLATRNAYSCVLVTKAVSRGGSASSHHRKSCKFLRFDNSQQPSQQHSQAQVCPVNLKGAVGATRLGIGLSAGTEEGVHAFRDHRAVVTFGVLWVKAHNGPRRRYGSQL